MNGCFVVVVNGDSGMQETAAYADQTAAEAWATAKINEMDRVALQDFADIRQYETETFAAVDIYWLSFETLEMWLVS